MPRLIETLAALLLAAAPAAAGAARLATGEGAPTEVPFSYRGKTLLLHAGRTAAALGWKAETLAGGRMLAFCHGQVCVPLRLGKVEHRKVEGELYVDAAALGRAMRFALERKGDSVHIRPEAGAAAPALRAYHEKWGGGRGFRKGQTLPDIPLYDLKGNEVRFSSFLGKRYIIYVWASW